MHRMTMIEVVSPDDGHRLCTSYASPPQLDYTISETPLRSAVRPLTFGSHSAEPPCYDPDELALTRGFCA